MDENGETRIGLVALGLFIIGFCIYLSYLVPSDSVAAGIFAVVMVAGIAIALFAFRTRRALTTNKRLVIAVLAVALAVSGSLNAVQYIQNNHISLLPLGGRLAATPAPEYQVLVDGNLSVNRYAYYLEFYVEGGSVNVQVNGSFRVLTDKPLRVYISAANADPDAPNFSPYFDSGYVFAGNINVTLPDARQGAFYNLVYVNQNGSNDAAVATKVSLNYWYAPQFG